MFTLASARGAIANPAYFARGGAYVREGRVTDVAVEERNGLYVYSGVVRGAVRSFRTAFEYDEMLDSFVRCSCTCGQSDESVWGCMHVAALMIAVCGGAAELPGDGSAFVGELLAARRTGAAGRALRQEPVRLYPVLRRDSAERMMLGLKIGRTRPYVVRSMAEFAQRVQRQEQTVYGRELTFGHREEEIAPEDRMLFGQIAMLAGMEGYAAGGELALSGAALDQMMRLMIGRTADIREADDAVRRVNIKEGAIRMDAELSGGSGRAQLQVLAGSVVLGASGAYQILEQEIVCALGDAYRRAEGLLRIAAQFPCGVRFDEGQLGEVCARLILPAKEDVHMRSGMAIVAAHTPTPATPRLYIDLQSDAEHGERLTCRVRLDYCGTELSPGQTHPHIRPDTALEEDVCAAAAALFPEKTGEGEYAFAGSEEERYLLLSERLPSLERAGEVMVSTRLAQMNVKKRRSMSMGLSLEGEKLTLKADLGGFAQEDLRAALGAYRQKRSYVRLSGGTFLSGEALEQAAQAAQVLDTLDVTAEQAQAGVEVPMSRALYLEEALKGREQIALKAPEALNAWIERLQTAQKTRVEQPAGLCAQLRGYQLEGLCWLSALSDAGFGGILADDMGLGKTIQALALLLREQERGETVRALVVCPASLQLNWLAEAKRFAPGLKSAALSGGAKERAQAIAALERSDAPNLLMTSYDQLRRDAQLYRNIGFSHVLLDEAQNIKNAASQAAKAVKTLRARRRFAMTGTPIENRLSELWSIFDFLMPGYLLSYKKFRERFEAPVVRDADEAARENLHMLVAPYILRRMKADVLDDLPEKVETVMNSEMTAEQRKLYAAHAAQLLKESEGGLAGGQDRIRMLAGLTRLRQICCDPRLCLEEYRGGSGKLVQLLEVVRDAAAGGHRMLLFSQFTSMLELIAQALEGEGIGYLMLTGDTDKAERMELVDRFNGGEGDVFLISLKAGGTGLNLTGADVVIHYDPWWNLAAQNQATDRAYRIGQTKGVQVIRLIASDTVEERILLLQQSKKALSDGVLGGEENLFNMDAEMMREILRG